MKPIEEIANYRKVAEEEAKELCTDVRRDADEDLLYHVIRNAVIKLPPGASTSEVAHAALNIGPGNAYESKKVVEKPIPACPCGKVHPPIVGEDRCFDYAA